jgi:uncharacterized spore protein YtfJ
MTKFSEMLAEAGESIGAKRVFGAPYEKNGVTVIPAARIMGGLGGGEGQAPGDDGTQSTGSGGGFGVYGRPAGAYVVKGDSVTWLPAVDVNRLMLGFQIALIVFLLVVRSVMKARAKAEMARSELASKG